MIRYHVPMALMLSLFSVAAKAEQTCIVSYTEFEEAIPHIDIASCPAKIGISDDDGFCRIVLEGDKAFVYGFIYDENDSCLIKVKPVSIKTILKKQ